MMQQSVKLKNRHHKAGFISGNGLLIALVVLVFSLAGVAIFKANAIENTVTRSFEGWLEDSQGYEKALSIQKETQQPILLYFYATWCPHCKRFSAEVLSAKKMQAFVKQYPHVRIAPDNGPEEKKLMREFGAQGYPTFFVLMPGKAPQVVETYAETPTPHLKTPQEFIDSIRTVVN